MLAGQLITGFVTSLDITTSLVDEVQLPLDIVHLKVAELLVMVTELVGLLGVVTIAVPETTVHAPVPTDGALPDKFVVFPQML